MLKNKKGRVTNNPKSESSKAKAPLPPRLLARLSKLREQQLKAQALRGTPDPDDGFVFLSQAGTRFWPRNVEREFARLLEKAGLDQTYPMLQEPINDGGNSDQQTGKKPAYKRKTCAVRFHDMRHTCASLLKHLGVDEGTINQWC